MPEFGGENKEIAYANAPFLLSLKDNEDNRLEIVIALAKQGEKGEGVEPDDYGDNEKLKEMYMESYPVYMDMDNVYKIVFEQYIIYQCRNEFYTVNDESEIKKGRYLYIYESSPFIDYSKAVTWDISEKTERKHYGIYTEFNVIDVITDVLPVITKVRRDHDLT